MSSSRTRSSAVFRDLIVDWMGWSRTERLIVIIAVVLVFVSLGLFVAMT
jgi:hypothetical protein